MWYLETDTLFLLLIAVGCSILFSGITRLLFKKDLAPKVLFLANVAVIGLISWQLLLFSFGYIIITFILIRNLTHRKKRRKSAFVVYCLLCTIPFFYGRMNEFFPQLPTFIAL